MKRERAATTRRAKASDARASGARPSPARTVRMTSAKAAALVASGKDGTDWARLRAMSDDEIQRGADEDPDAPAIDDAAWAAAVALRDRKQAISLRVDADVLAWFRAQGPRYQSRMNAVLRAYMDHRRRGA